ncbi:hypothetical protein B0H66DRAFT_248706 [Apodospora peruviana]|uniref:Uncharacterized protein n=1 Tax=Apodospora peruviana TaxID=516989 RepID=A0AAE0I5A8_9PEZI|nr:hypothetical protein B0H66DRAFT_248706 [Apodospora peruviana]
MRARYGARKFWASAAPWYPWLSALPITGFPTPPADDDNTSFTTRSANILYNWYCFCLGLFICSELEQLDISRSLLLPPQALAVQCLSQRRR